MISHFSQPLFYFYFITGSLSLAGWLPFKFCQNTRKIYKDCTIEVSLKYLTKGDFYVSEKV